MAADDAYLGVDCGTQSMKAEVYSTDFRLLASCSVPYSELLDASVEHVVETIDGVDGSAGTQPLLWLRALDRVLSALHAKDAEQRAAGGCGFLARVRAVCGSGQQHGSVYWKHGAATTLASLDAAQPMAQQLSEAFAVRVSPIWMDASTSSQCRQLCRAAYNDSADEQAQRTGSGLYERFTGNQILKIAEQRPAQLLDTERIALVSSFVASLFLGRHAPIDYADACGTSLFDVHSRHWCPAALQAASAATPVDMAALLGGAPVPNNTLLGPVSDYMRRRYGFASDCSVCVFSGDNPCTLSAMRLLVDAGRRAAYWVVSLGTSDTLLAPTDALRPSADCGHFMINPLSAGDQYMFMLCYKNGSGARLTYLNRWLPSSSSAADDYGRFGAALRATSAGNEGRLGFYFRDPEIYPRLAVGEHRFGADDAPVPAFASAQHDVRAMIESRFLSMRGHGRQFGIPPPRGVIATGGGAQTPEILQVIADVFNVPVYSVAESPNGAAMGAAFLAYLAAAAPRLDQLPPLDYRQVCAPAERAADVYSEALLDRFLRLEKTLVGSW